MCISFRSNKYFASMIIIELQNQSISIFKSFSFNV